MTARTKRTPRKRAARKKGAAAKPTGRPPIIEKGWNPDDRTWAAESPAGRLLAALRLGSYVAPACALAGVGTTTRKSWLHRGREFVDGGEPDWDTIPESEQPYVAFVVASELAEAVAEVELVGMVRQAAHQDWRAAIALLARRHPDRWRERHGIDAQVESRHTQLTPAEAAELLDDPTIRAGAEALEDALAAIHLADDKNG